MFINPDFLGVQEGRSLINETLIKNKAPPRSLQPQNSEISLCLQVYISFFFFALSNIHLGGGSFRLFQYKQISVYIFTKILRKHPTDAQPRKRRSLGYLGHIDIYVYKFIPGNNVNFCCI